MRTLNDRLAPVRALAATQHGAVGKAQLRRVGFTAAHERAAVAAGQLLRATVNVVIVAGAPDTWMQRLSIALLALGPTAFVSHESAAALLGLDGFRPGPPTITVTRGQRLVHVPGVVIHTTQHLGRADVLTVNGLRCASATRTVCDLAAIGRPERVVAAAIDSAVRLRLSAPLVLERRLEATRGRGVAGVRLLDALLVDAVGESVLERRFLKLVREAGLGDRSLGPPRAYSEPRPTA